jgi:hypothetical protein
MIRDDSDARDDSLGSRPVSDADLATEHLLEARDIAPSLRTYLIYVPGLLTLFDLLLSLHAVLILSRNAVVITTHPLIRV